MKYFFIAILAVCFSASARAQDESAIKIPPAAVAATAATVRALTMETVKRMDYDTVRMKRLDEFRALSDADFDATYAEMWKSISLCRQRFGFREHMSKTEFIHEASRLTFSKFKAMIDSIPDAVVVAEIEKEVARTKSRMPAGGLDKQLSWLLSEAQQNLQK